MLDDDDDDTRVQSSTRGAARPRKRAYLVGREARRVARAISPSHPLVSRQ